MLSGTIGEVMKICIVGAGAIGGLIGAQLAQTGDHAVSVLARGATLDALRGRGWTLENQGKLLEVAVTASDTASDLGTQDLIVIAVKGMSMPAIASQIAPLMHANTVVMPALNGVPWWLASALPVLEGQSLESVDPGGAIAQQIPYPSILGCVVHASAFVKAPAHVVHVMGQGLIIGEPQGGSSQRVEDIRQVLSQAGFDVTASASIVRDIWYKLWGNMTMNPISAMTGATADRVLDDPLVRKFCASAMREAAEIGTKIGCDIAQTPEDRHAVTRKLGAFKTSMLQDALAGRALELDGIVTVVHELGQKLEVATPNIDAILGLTRLFARVHGLYPE